MIFCRIKKIKSNLKSNKAFTLVELLLYLAIIAIFIGVVSSFLITLLQSRAKNQTIAEVEQQGIQVMYNITQSIRNSEGINSPSQGTSSSTLSLDVINAGDDPTVFDLSGGTIRITEGVGSAIDLTNSNVTVTGLTFNNLSRSGTPGTIQIEFTLTHVNPEGRQEFDFSKTFTDTASLRY